MELLKLDHIAISYGERLAFAGAHWTWRRGEQWAVIGPNGAGKSLLALALCGQIPVVRGEVETAGGTIALLSPHVQRDLITRASSFHK